MPAVNINRFKLFILFLIVSFLAVPLAVCQEGAEDVIIEEEQGVAGEQDWLWGEVLSVYNQDNQIKLKVLDEESLEEKEVLVYVDKETIFDNADSLLDIKPTDSLSIDYIITGDGKNIARRITVEKAQEEDLSLPEAVLNNTQPTYP